MLRYIIDYRNRCAKIHSSLMFLERAGRSAPGKGTRLVGEMRVR